jgi:hypothetical protein
MKEENNKYDTAKDNLPQEEDTSINDSFLQLEILYKSRCVQPPSGSNVTVREVKAEFGS